MLFGQFLAPLYPFAKTLCDLAREPFKPHMSTTLSAAFDVYCSLIQSVCQRVNAVLGRDDKDWQMLNSCPPCQYQLKQDLPLEVRMIVEIDRKNSLRLVERRGDAALEPLREGEEEGATRLGPPKEQRDPWVSGGDYFLPREEVNLWVKEAWQDRRAEQIPSGVPSSIHAIHVHGKGSAALEWGRETNWEIGMCIRLWMQARKANLLPMVGLMHGYAHECLCQLLFLMLYIAGMGLEDGEGCEHYFSMMNALAGITQHMSVFHCHQAIAEVAYAHDHLEMYANVSRFIYNNYCQALEIMGTRNALSQSMIQAGIQVENFFEWLEEEGNYLQSLTRTAPSEMLEMEYFLKLESLTACQGCLQNIQDFWKAYKVSGNNAVTTRNTETKHRNEQENECKLIANVQALEGRLGVTSRWKEGSEEWVAAKMLVKECEYRKVLDKLEGLLVARIFEMTRLKVAGTGYKMRKHLANALKSQLKSIQAAIEACNSTAHALSPPSESELTRLHTEIWKMVTYMEDKEDTIRLAAERVGSSDPALALQIQLQGNMHSWFNCIHWQRFWAITKLKGFRRENMVHFCHGTLVMVQDWVEMDTTEDVDMGSIGEHDGKIEPDLLHAVDERSITQEVERVMYAVEDD
ncbi:hypothetical protein BT96DRAFT_1055428 [Gymnopus androsaceus JB14]|uniref:Uncharacterized protein n=1 Tax=Gymnopus androsaceus JB14 TaxID=1447944 RepID=A0A6A4H479_9AGAR|nr:hypothetical protein BT96DRAFT_1055428 [Gymnopus androsaceus JB14]